MTSTSKTKTRTNLTQADFDKMKMLQNVGINATQAGKITGRSSGTASYIYRSETFEEYKQMVVNARARYPDYRKEYTVETVSAEQPQKEVATTNEPTELARIATALERLATAWEAQPAKKRLF